ncbi:Cytochrome c oxidase assembly protein COX19, partial [Bienertia sinuspersici]
IENLLFEQELFSAKNLKPEGAEDILGEELVKPKLEIQEIVKRDWRSSYREIMDDLFFTGGVFGGTRGARVVPPEKEVFPLDHERELVHDLGHYCRKKRLFELFKTFGHQSETCREFSKKYLRCQMEK